MKPKIYTASSHEIDHRIIDPDAIFIIEHLRNNGHDAYLVGGGVRDLLIKKQPKDYDISTSAKPEEIKQIFGRRCLLIGRRFRLAHVRTGKKIFEVSTFRSGDIESDDLVTNDNVWGSAEEDVIRRDFTINGLYYDPTDQTVIDYVGGWDDIQKKVIRTIGPAYARFNQDPVRMIRLLKFKARLDFDIDDEALTALEKCRETITLSAPARILEEILRMLESGASKPFFELLTKHQFLDILFPWLMHFLESEKGDATYAYLEKADHFNNNARYRPLDRSVLLSCLLYPILDSEVKTQYIDRGVTPSFGKLLDLTFSLIKAVITSSFSHFPKRLSAVTANILSSQYRLTPLGHKKLPPQKVVHSKDFSLSLRFLKLRSLVDPELLPVYEDWKEEYAKGKSR